MGTLIDASVLIAAEGDQLDVGPLITSEPCGLAAITVAELLHGFHRAKYPSQRQRRQALLDFWLAHMKVIPFDLEAAKMHARVWADLASRGPNFGSHDLMIAATALVAGAAVLTRDRRSFPLVPNPAVRLC